MDDKRLDGIGVALGVTSGPTIAHELYEEVRRLRAEQIELRDAVRLEREAFDKRGARVTQQRAELAAAWKERDAATTRAETAERELDRQRKANRDVAKQRMDAMERATTAERELAELRMVRAELDGLRALLGAERFEWGIADDAEKWVDGALITEEAARRQALGHADVHVVRRVVGEWKAADGGQ